MIKSKNTLEINAHKFLTTSSHSDRLFNFYKKYELFIVFFILLLANYLLRWVFEMHHKPLPNYFDQIGIKYQNSNWYTFMDPMQAKSWGGTWSSLGIGLMPLFQMTLGMSKTFLLLNFLFVAAGYWLSWLVFRSRLLTFTVGICLAFTTLNDHVYQNSSLIIIYIPFILAFINMYSVFRLFECGGVNAKKYWVVWWITLLLYMSSFEGWLDYYAVTLVISLACWYLLHKQQDYKRMALLFRLVTTMTLLAVGYIFLKVNYGNASHSGDEHDVIFNYGRHHYLLIIDDFISNFFTFFYMTITTYLPPIFSFSRSYLKYGPQTIMELQKGYDAPNAYLAVMNAVLLWRFYAGVYLTIFLYFFAKIAKKVYFNFERDSWFLFIFMLMVLFGSPAHFLVKFRPMHVIPWLQYQAFMGQIGLMLLIGYSIKMLHESVLSKKSIWIMTVVVWGVIMLGPYWKAPIYQAGVNYVVLTDLK